MFKFHFGCKEAELFPRCSFLVTSGTLAVTFCQQHVTFCSMFFTFSSQLVTFCSLLVTFCLLLVTFSLLVVTFCLLLVTFCFLLVTFSLLLVTFCLLLVTFCQLLVTLYSLLVTFCSLLVSAFFLLQLKSRSARGASFYGQLPDYQSRVLALSTQQMSSLCVSFQVLLKEMRTRGESNISSCYFCDQCKPRELGGRRSPRFPCVTPVVESFFSDVL